MKATQSERDEVLAYFAHQSDDDPVVHLEKVHVERVGPNVFDIWDVHCADSLTRIPEIPHSRSPKFPT